MWFLSLIGGFSAAMTVELCWRAYAKLLLGTPQHMLVLMPGSTSRKTGPLALVAWMASATLGASILFGSVITGQWGDVIFSVGGIACWLMYRWLFYRLTRHQKA